jgi:hypothetical protein
MLVISSPKRKKRLVQTHSLDIRPELSIPRPIVADLGSNEKKDL